MANKIDNITNRLQELDDQVKVDTRKYKSELDSAKVKLDALMEQREQAATPEDYKHITNDIEEQRNFISFLENKQEQLKNSSLSKDEYQDIQTTINNELDDLIRKAAPEIANRLFPAIELMENYLQKVDYLDDLYRKANKLKGSSYLGARLDRSKLMDAYDDHYDWFNEFCLMCFKHHAVIHNCKRRSKYILNNPWLSASLKKYARD